VTILVGVLARDGAVVAADQAVTVGLSAFQNTIADRVEKLHLVGDQVIVTGTGETGMLQRLSRSAQHFFGYLRAPATIGDSPLQVLANTACFLPEMVAAARLHEMRQTNDAVQIGVMISQLMNEAITETHGNRGQFGALIAYVVDNTPHLCQFQMADFQPEQKTDTSWYVSMGTGQILADPYLALMRRTFWKDGQPSVESAVFTAFWVIYHAIEAAPGLIAHPIDMAVLKKWDGERYTARLMTDAEREEHLDAVRASDQHLVAFLQPHISPIPPPPEPPSPSLPKSE